MSNEYISSVDEVSKSRPMVPAAVPAAIRSEWSAVELHAIVALLWSSLILDISLCAQLSNNIVYV
jgi:hypothetical protein